MKWSWRKLLTGVIAGVMIESIAFYLIMLLSTDEKWDLILLFPLSALVGLFAAMSAGLIVGIGAGIGCGLNFMINYAISVGILTSHFKISGEFFEVAITAGLTLVLGVVSAAIGAGLVALIELIRSSAPCQRLSRYLNGNKQ